MYPNHYSGKYDVINIEKMTKALKKAITSSKNMFYQVKINKLLNKIIKN
jgi:hypothetical protein